MRKFSLQMAQQQMFSADVSDGLEADIVLKASRWVKRLLKCEHKGLGDTVELAIRRASNRYKIPESCIWALRYRPPKDLGTRIFLSILRAYRDECLRQEARLEAELELNRKLPSTPARAALIREVEALLGQARAELEQLGRDLAELGLGLDLERA